MARGGTVPNEIQPANAHAREQRDFSRGFPRCRSFGSRYQTEVRKRFGASPGEVVVDFVDRNMGAVEVVVDFVDRERGAVGSEKRVGGGGARTEGTGR